MACLLLTRPAQSREHTGGRRFGRSDRKTHLPPQTRADPRSTPPRTHKHRRPDSSAQAADDFTGGAFITSFATHELAKLRGVLAPGLVIRFIQQLSHGDAIRRTQRVMQPTRCLRKPPSYPAVWSRVCDGGIKTKLSFAFGWECGPLTSGKNGSMAKRSESRS